MEEDIKDTLRHLNNALESIRDAWNGALGESTAIVVLELQNIHRLISRSHTALEELQR